MSPKAVLMFVFVIASGEATIASLRSQ